MRKELPSLCTEQEGRGVGFCRDPSCASSSRWASATFCRKSPLASARSKRAVRDSLDFLFDPHASFSLGRRGGMCHATLGGRERWHFRLSYYRVSPSGGPYPVRWGSASGPGTRSKSTGGFSSGCRGRSLGLGGSVPPYGGIPFGDFPAGLEHDLGCPERSSDRSLGPRPFVGSPQGRP